MNIGTDVWFYAHKLRMIAWLTMLLSQLFDVYELRNILLTYF